MRKWNKRTMSMVLLAGLLTVSGCNGIGTAQETDSSVVQDSEKTEKNNTVEEKQPQETVVEAKNYINEEGTCIKDRIAVPEGFVRVAYKKKSFGAFLRNYPLC